MTTKTKTEETVYGAVEYETVTCDSCENEVVREDAKRFVIGDLNSERDRFDYRRFEFHDGTWAAGWACPHCYDAGPAEYPQQSRVRSYLASVDEEDVLAWVFIIAGCLSILAVVLFGVVP